MKEATGELNMTVVTVVAVAAIGAFFTVLVWPNIKTSMMASTVCSNGPRFNTGAASSADYVSCGTLSGSNSYQCKYNVLTTNGSLTTKIINCNAK